VQFEHFTKIEIFEINEGISKLQTLFPNLAQIFAFLFRLVFYDEKVFD